MPAGKAEQCPLSLSPSLFLTHTLAHTHIIYSPHTHTQHFTHTLDTNRHTHTAQHDTNWHTNAHTDTAHHMHMHTHFTHHFTRWPHAHPTLHTLTTHAHTQNHTTLTHTSTNRHAQHSTTQTGTQCTRWHGSPHSPRGTTHTQHFTHTHTHTHTALHTHARVCRRLKFVRNTKYFMTCQRTPTWMTAYQIPMSLRGPELTKNSSSVWFPETETLRNLMAHALHSSYGGVYEGSYVKQILIQVNFTFLVCRSSSTYKQQNQVSRLQLQPMHIKWKFAVDLPK